MRARVALLGPPVEGVRGQRRLGARRCMRCTYRSGLRLAAIAAGPSTDRALGGWLGMRRDRTWRRSLTASRSVPSATPWCTRRTGRCRGCGARRASTSSTPRAYTSGSLPARSPRARCARRPSRALRGGGRICGCVCVCIDETVIEPAERDSRRARRDSRGCGETVAVTFTCERGL